MPQFARSPGPGLQLRDAMGLQHLPAECRQFQRAARLPRCRPCTRASTTGRPRPGGCRSGRRQPHRARPRCRSCRGSLRWWCRRCGWCRQAGPGGSSAGPAGPGPASGRDRAGPPFRDLALDGHRPQGFEHDQAATVSGSSSGRKALLMWRSPTLRGFAGLMLGVAATGMALTGCTKPTRRGRHPGSHPCGHQRHTFSDPVDISDGQPDDHTHGNRDQHFGGRDHHQRHHRGRQGLSQRRQGERRSWPEDRAYRH